MKNLIYLYLMTLMLTSCATTKAPIKTGYAPVNGINMYYEMHGKGGVPLVLLHGGGSTIEVTYGQVISQFAKNRQVIAVEEQAHGRTSDRNGPVSFEATADDVAELLKQLKIEKADFFGFSNGASTALQIGIRHPQLMRKLVFASSMTKRSGAPVSFWQFMKTAELANMPQPLKDAFLKVNPDPKKLQIMHDKDADRMRNFKDVSDKDVKNLKATSTLILVGDKDLVTHEHAVWLAKTIPNSRLIVLLSGHGEYLEGRLALPTAAYVEEFLNAN